MSNQERGRSAQRRVSRRKTTSLKAARGGSKRVAHRARRDWDDRGARAPRFHLLRSMLPVVERNPQGHHVVVYDPEEQYGHGPQRRATRRSARGRTAPTGRGRRVVREDEEDLEEVQSTSRRRAMRPTSMVSGDKIEIEVGAVKALSTKYGVMRGATWMVILSLMLWWVPVLGPAAVGYIGGRKSGGPIRAAGAATIPIVFAFAGLGVLSNSAQLIPQVAKHLVTETYQLFLASLPFNFPIVAYIFTNLGAIMASGPDVFFTVLAFALVGGAVTQMRIAERSVPPITARLPKHRVFQGPARAYEDSHDAVDDLVDRLTTVLDRTDGRQRAARPYAVPSAPVVQFAAPVTARRSGWFHRRHEAPLQYPQLQASRQNLVAQERTDAVSRQVVSSILAATPPVASGRRAKSANAAPDFDLPATLAVAALSAGRGAEGLAGAHLYRPSKLYHIYGASVNPVARAKLEKRLRRTHTIHTMRRAGHAVSARRQAEVEPQLVDDAQDEVDPLKPRSLETDALAADLHYDAMEHLENASLEKLPHPVRRKVAGEDELGGLIAHIGEGGEAVVDGSAVDDVEHERGPVFDRKGRQRARIAGEAPRHEKDHTRVVEVPVKKETPAAKAVRETIDSVDGREAMAKALVAKSADRSDLSVQQKEKVERWLKHTLSEIDLDTGKPKARSPAPHAVSETKEEKPAAHAQAKKAPEAESAPKHEPEHEKKAEPTQVEDAPKPHARHKEASPPPAFEITHGSIDVDAEAGSADSESQVVKRHKSAAEILKEIKAQKRADDEQKAQVEAANASKAAKQEADEIERHVRQSVAAEPEMVPMKSHDGSEKPAEAASPPLRHRSEPYETVARDADKLSGDLELTLTPIRDETPVHITELGDLPAEHVHAAPPVDGDAGIPMVGESSKRVSVSEAVAQVVEVALKAAPPVVDEEDVERKVKPSDIVLGGPSTDLPRAASDESYLNDHERAKVAKRMEEGWNRM